MNIWHKIKIEYQSYCFAPIPLKNSLKCSNILLYKIQNYSDNNALKQTVTCSDAAIVWKGSSIFFLKLDFFNNYVCMLEIFVAYSSSTYSKNHLSRFTIYKSFGKLIFLLLAKISKTGNLKKSHFWNKLTEVL